MSVLDGAARVVDLGSDGLGRTEAGEPAPFALPGDLVDHDGRVTRNNPAHVAAPCGHYGICGGCAMQHASNGFVADWKAQRVLETLRANGIEGEVAEVATSPPGTRRRAKLSGRRTKKGALVGFHQRRTHTVVAVPDCQVVVPGIAALVPALEGLTRQIGSRKGEVGYTVTMTANGADVLIEGGKELTAPLRLALSGFAATHGLARLTWEDEPIVTRMPPVQRLGRADVAPPPGAFLQATAEGEAALVAGVRAAVGDAKRIVDLFAGCGTFTLPLAERAEVHAVEYGAPMLRALDHGWRHAKGLKKVTTETRDLFREPLLAEDLARFDAAVVDPPRKGARAQVAEIASSKLPRVAMVSCQPASFAADARLLHLAGFAMGPVTLVDQFRWSPHIELVAAFTRL
ncbi:class I SAM-dependent RNA methyltransferase [Roseisalinus antarcticus]|uniref:23S rRNA (Uracil(1939)-C(5))-methyltransferase RlmD n=1 Tax=Roseisalinus antarcticus TaxID=254357 RepID=A0A1Y5S8W4_9RHOB|nr:class I SAM-dependent RNA methyltransferase [Roseisalinus antarcticus]SLN32730.1 23S rRNA (uracil(1939)-C(5))-methyltransferase RlmD [Roseisalinus antarcticus]